MPEIIQPSEEYREISEKSKLKKRVLGETENELIDLKNLLTAAEPFLRYNQLKKIKYSLEAIKVLQWMSIRE
jgi:hypothetical protein